MAIKYSASTSIVSVGMINNLAFDLSFLETTFEKYLSLTGPKNAQAAIQKTSVLSGSPMSTIGAANLPGYTGVVPSVYSFTDNSSIRNSVMDHAGEILGYTSDFSSLDLSKFVQVMSAVQSHSSKSIDAMRPVVIAGFSNFPKGWNYSDLPSGGLVKISKDPSRINEIAEPLLRTGKFYGYKYRNLDIAGTPQDLALNLYQYDTTGIFRTKLLDTITDSPVSNIENQIKIMSDQDIIKILSDIYGPDMLAIFEAMEATTTKSIRTMADVLSPHRMLDDISDIIQFTSFSELATMLSYWPDVKRLKGTSSVATVISTIVYEKLPLLDELNTPMDPTSYEKLVEIYGEGTGEYNAVTLLDMIGSIVAKWIDDSFDRCEVILGKMETNTYAIEADRLFKIAADIMDGVYDYDIANYPDWPDPDYPGPVQPPVATDIIIRLPDYGDYNTKDEAIAMLVPLIELQLANLYSNMVYETNELRMAYNICSDRIMIENNLFLLANIVIADLDDNQIDLSEQFGLAIDNGIMNEVETQAEYIYSRLANTSDKSGQAVIAAINEKKLRTVKII